MGTPQIITLYSDRHVRERLHAYEERERQYANQDIVITGIATGLDGLDEVTLGIQLTDLWVVQGRTGVGKTYFLCHLAANMRSQDRRILFVNREMDPEHVMGRIDALSAHFSYRRWRSGKLTSEEVNRYHALATHLTNGAKGRIDVVPPITTLTPALLKGIMKKYKPDIVFVDYINRLEPDDLDSRDPWRASRAIADALKDIAYHDSIPVIVAAQSNRAAVMNKAYVPGTEHLYGGNALGWNADLVLSMFRTEEMMARAQMGMRMAKYRHGEELDLTLKWDLDAGTIAVECVDNRVIPNREEELPPL
jgi:replicative DNA helicase